MNAKRKVFAAAAIVAASIALAGCSQVAALAPVGGNHLTEVRFAAIDVLTSGGIDILTAPVCAEGAASAGGGVTCAGETVDHRAISVTSEASDPTTMTVLVGTTQLYSGSIFDVLNDEARATP